MLPTYVLVLVSVFTRGGLSRHHHASDGGTPGSTAMCELTRNFHSVLSPSSVVEDSRSGEGFQVCPVRGCPRLQLASSSPAPRARWCGQKYYVFDQFTVGMYCGVTKPAEPSLHEQCRYTCKADAVRQFRRWHTISAPHVQNVADVFIVKDIQHPSLLVQAISCNFGAEFSTPLPVRPCPLYFTPRPKAGLQARECGTSDKGSMWQG